jgi:hypothetical protein
VKGREMTTERVLYHEYGIQLREDGEGRLVLNVLCGRVGQYGVEFALDEREREGYKRSGDEFIKDLAWKVAHAPEAYGERGRFC